MNRIIVVALTMVLALTLRLVKKLLKKTEKIFVKSLREQI